jgi:hypothetical protein
MQFMKFCHTSQMFSTHHSTAYAQHQNNLNTFFIKNLPGFEDKWY